MKPELIRPFLIVCFSLLSFHVYGQEEPITPPKEEIVPVVLPDKPDFSNWIKQELPLWGGICAFPDTPYYTVKEIYTEKGVVPEKHYKWEDGEQTILLEISSYKLPEKVSPKTEKKLADAIAQRYAIIHGGYPEVALVTSKAPGIKVYDVEIRTMKKQTFKARIFMEDEQVLIATALVMQLGTIPRSQANYFLDQVSFNPLPGELSANIIPEKKGLFTKSTKEEERWDTLDVSNFSATFPKYPVGQHRLIRQMEEDRKYFEWYVADADKGTIYLLAMIPLEKENPDDWSKLVNQGINSTLSITGSELVSRRPLDFFKFPAEEVVMKTKQQSFRVRYFSDGQYLYQMVVGGTETNIFDAAANKFLDGLKWR